MNIFAAFIKEKGLNISRKIFWNVISTQNEWKLLASCKYLLLPALLVNMIGLQWWPILQVGGALFLEARCPISQLTGLFMPSFQPSIARSWNDITDNSISATFKFRHHICRYFNFLLKKMGNNSYFRRYFEIANFVTFLHIIHILWTDMSVDWNVFGLNFGWTFFYNPAVCWQNEKNTCAILIQVVSCVKHVQIRVSTYNLVCSMHLVQFIMWSLHKSLCTICMYNLVLSAYIPVCSVCTS